MIGLMCPDSSQKNSTNVPGLKNPRIPACTGRQGAYAHGMRSVDLYSSIYYSYNLSSRQKFILSWLVEPASVQRPPLCSRAVKTLAVPSRPTGGAADGAGIAGGSGSRAKRVADHLRPVARRLPFGRRPPSAADAAPRPTGIRGGAVHPFEAPPTLIAQRSSARVCAALAAYMYPHLSWCTPTWVPWGWATNISVIE